jgi:hypothetical protein
MGPRSRHAVGNVSDRARNDDGPAPALGNRILGRCNYSSLCPEVSAAPGRLSGPALASDKRALALAAGQALFGALQALNG